MSYMRIFAMILTASVVMYAVMYLNTYALDHVFFSQTRLWMTLLMASTMAVIMLGFMLNMYANKKANIAIVLGAIVVFGSSLALVRSQTTVDDVSYMRAMIPHHSIAILTSERAQISDPRLRELANQIIKAQGKEIAEMKALIADIEADR